MIQQLQGVQNLSPFRHRAHSLRFIPSPIMSIPLLLRGVSPLFGNGKECREECGAVAMLRQNNHGSIASSTFPASLGAFSHSFCDQIGGDWKSIGDHRQFIYCNRASRNEEEEEEEEEEKRRVRRE